MSELISRGEAKLAWANGKKLQIANTIVGEDFYDMDDSNTMLNIFDLDFYRFRLKPRTITINGMEVPKSSDTYSGGLIWILCGTDIREYTSLALDENDELPAYFWRTEDEIKQVVSALRSVFKGGV
jgi:hypothetical protein